MNDTPSIHSLRRESPADPIPLFQADSFVQQLRLAAQAHRAGRLDEAIQSYLRLLLLRPYHTELHNNLGVALRLIGKLEASVAHHRLSLTSDADNPALHSNLGNALRAAGQLDEAVKHHFVGLMLVQAFLVQWRQIEQISYGEFRSLVESGKLSEVVVSDSTLRGKLVTPRDDGKSMVVTNR